MFLSLYINTVSTRSQEASCSLLTAFQTVDIKAHTRGVPPQLRLWTLTGAFPTHVKSFLGEIPKLHPMHPSVYESVLKMHVLMLR